MTIGSKLQTYTAADLASYGRFTAELASLLEFSVGARAKRMIHAADTFLLGAWSCNYEPYAAAYELRRKAGTEATGVTINGTR